MKLIKLNKRFYVKKPYQTQFNIQTRVILNVVMYDLLCVSKNWNDYSNLITDLLRFDQYFSKFIVCKQFKISQNIYIMWTFRAPFSPVNMSEHSWSY